jgi:hypothetical protein
MSRFTCRFHHQYAIKGRVKIQKRRIVTVELIAKNNNQMTATHGVISGFGSASCPVCFRASLRQASEQYFT